MSSKIRIVDASQVGSKTPNIWFPYVEDATKVNTYDYGGPNENHFKAVQYNANTDKNRMEITVEAVAKSPSDKGFDIDVVFSTKKHPTSFGKFTFFPFQKKEKLIDSVPEKVTGEKGKANFTVSVKRKLAEPGKTLKAASVIGPNGSEYDAEIIQDPKDEKKLNVALTAPIGWKRAAVLLSMTILSDDGSMDSVEAINSVWE